MNCYRTATQVSRVSRGTGFRTSESAVAVIRVHQQTQRVEIGVRTLTADR